MKKIVYAVSCLVLILIFILLFNSIYNGKKSGLLVCKYHGYNDNYEYISTYNVKYKNRIVYNVNSVETIISNDSSYLDKTKTELENQYFVYKDLKYYDNNIELKKDRIITTTNINYKKINMKELIKVDSSVKKHVDKNDNIDVSSFKKEYEKNGTKCSYK